MQIEGEVASVVDVRQRRCFSEGHFHGSACIPWPEVRERTHELPPSGALLHLISLPCDEKDVQGFLASRNWTITEVTLVEEGRPLESRPGLDVVAGELSGRLWSPCPSLVRHLPEILISLEDQPLPLSALDLGCGVGRDSVFLAGQQPPWQVLGIENRQYLADKAADLANRDGIEDACRFSVRDVSRDWTQWGVEAESVSLEGELRFF
eukprot:gene3628-676_t